MEEKNCIKQATVISTNWGSDIYYFANDKFHEQKIKNLLRLSDFYSAECIRDYELAKKLGFGGNLLPCLPNAGGFKDINTEPIPMEERFSILCKGYGGKFGMGLMCLEIIEKFLTANPSVPVYI